MLERRKSVCLQVLALFSLLVCLGVEHTPHQFSLLLLTGLKITLVEFQFMECSKSREN